MPARQPNATAMPDDSAPADQGHVPTVRSTSVDVAGLLTVLGENLYSTPLAGLRELVQNAHDSIVRRRLEDAPWDGGTVRVDCLPSRGTLTVSDDGAGLTEEEIHAFLATIGRGYTRALRTQSGSQELIGMFGLGFLSAFVLAREVTVETTSFRDPQNAWVYRSSGGERYTVARATPGEVGTRVSLQLRDEHRHLLEPGTLRRVLGRYCALLPIPVVAGDGDAVNAEPPPWRRDLSDMHPTLRRRSALEFAQRFEERFEPLVTMDVDRRDGDAAVQGILWVNGGLSYATSDQRRLAVFVRGMLLDDDARDLLPDWAGFVSGVIESTSLTPTASREDLQRDAQWEAVRAQLQESLIDGLAAVAQQQQEAWRRVLRRHNEALLGASLCDPRLFDLLVDQVQVPTTQGDMSVRVAQQAGGGKLHVAVERDGGLAATLFGALRIPVLRGDRFAVLPFVRRYAARRMVPLVEIGTRQGDSALFTPASLPDADAQWLEERLLDEGEALMLSSFAPAELPLVLVADREAELKQLIEADEADGRMSRAALHLARLHTGSIEERAAGRLHVNVASPLIRAVLAARGSNPQGAELASRALRGFKRMTERARGDGGPADRRDTALADIAPVVMALCDPEEVTA